MHASHQLLATGAQNFPLLQFTSCTSKNLLLCCCQAGNGHCMCTTTYSMQQNHAAANQLYNIVTSCPFVVADYDVTGRTFPEGHMRVMPHTDMSALTLLFQRVGKIHSAIQPKPTLPCTQAPAPPPPFSPNYLLLATIALSQISHCVFTHSHLIVMSLCRTRLFYSSLDSPHHMLPVTMQFAGLDP